MKSIVSSTGSSQEELQFHPVPALNTQKQLNCVMVVKNGWARVQAAVNNVNGPIRDRIVGMDHHRNQSKIDNALIELDGSPNKGTFRSELNTWGLTGVPKGCFWRKIIGNISLPMEKLAFQYL